MQEREPVKNTTSTATSFSSGMPNYEHSAVILNSDKYMLTENEATGFSAWASQIEMTMKTDFLLNKLNPFDDRDIDRDIEESKQKKNFLVSKIKDLISLNESRWTDGAALDGSSIYI